MNNEQLKSYHIKRNSNGFYFWFCEVGIRSTSGIKRFSFPVGFVADETAKFISRDIMEKTQYRDDVWKLLLNRGCISETVDFEIVEIVPRLRCDITGGSVVSCLQTIPGYYETGLKQLLTFRKTGTFPKSSEPVPVADVVTVPAVSSESAPAPADSKRKKTVIDTELMVKIGEYIRENITERKKLTYRAIAREFNLGSGTISSNKRLKKFIDKMINSESSSIDNNHNFDNDPYSNWKKD